MRVVDHEPQWWFLLEEVGELFLDGTYDSSFVGYDFMIRLNPDELVKYRAQGHEFINWLAEDIQNRAPILETSRSVYKERKLPSDYSERSLAAIEERKRTQ